MGEIIDMQTYRLRKSARRLIDSQEARHGIMSASDLLRERRAREGKPLHGDPSEPRAKVTFLNTTEHPAGRGLKGRHE